MRPVAYDAFGDVTDPLGDRTQYCYDAVGRLTGVISPKGSAVGSTCSSASPAFTTTITPNAFGDPLSVTDVARHVD